MKLDRAIPKIVALLSVYWLASFALACAQNLSDTVLMQIRFDQRLNARVSPQLTFRDESGQEVALGHYFGKKPLVLILGYYGCPMLCTLVLNGMMESAEDMRWSIGREFEVLNVSINPAETPALAAGKKRSYVRRYGRSGATEGWHFLVGEEAAIHQLAGEVGFRYAYDAASKQYAHPSGLIILDSEGKVSSYLFGVTFASKDFYSALERASAHKVSSPIQQFILLCFHYNPITGKYSGAILLTVRILSVFTLLGISALIFVLVSRGRAAQDGLSARERSPAASSQVSAK